MTCSLKTKNENLELGTCGINDPWFYREKSGVNPALSRNCIREFQHRSPVTKGCWGNDLESEC